MTELDRRRRVVDMMVSMHAILRDRYHQRQLAVDLLQLLAGIVVVATTFLDAEIAGLLGLSAVEAQVSAGIAGAVVFGLSVVSLRVNWAEQSVRHGQAVERLAEVKSRLRTYSSSEAGNDDLQAQFERADLVMRELPPIPDGLFVKLKGKHELKVAMSREIEKSPGRPLLLLRLGLLRDRSRPDGDRDRG